MDVSQQVTAALHAAHNPPALADTWHDAADGDRSIYALGWVVANAIVTARYHDSALDVCPVEHPETRWDRFVLTRRVSCDAYRGEPADAFGYIMLTGDDAPRLTHPNGETRLALGRLLRDDPAGAIGHVLDLLPTMGLASGDHTACWHQRAPKYPMLYAAVTQLIVAYPALLAGREVVVDDGTVDGAYHPLYLHTSGHIAPIAYDWFVLEHHDAVVFARINGAQTVYRTEAGNWATVAESTPLDTVDDLARRLRACLSIAGAPRG